MRADLLAGKGVHLNHDGGGCDGAGDEMGGIGGAMAVVSLFSRSSLAPFWRNFSDDARHARRGRASPGLSTLVASGRHRNTSSFEAERPQYYTAEQASIVMKDSIDRASAMMLKELESTCELLSPPP